MYGYSKRYWRLLNIRFQLAGKDVKKKPDPLNAGPA